MTSVILNAVKNLPEGWFPAERMLLYYQVRRFCLSRGSFAGLLRMTGCLITAMLSVSETSPGRVVSRGADIKRKNKI